MHPTGAPEPNPAAPAGPAVPRRWLAVGVSTAVDSRQAGVDAATQAVAGGAPALLLVFCSSQHDPAAVLAGIAEVGRDAPLIGCSSSAVIAAGGPSHCGVVVAALGGPGFSAATGYAVDADHRQRHAGAEVARCAMKVDERPHQVLLLLTDGTAQDQEEILSGAYDVVGASMPLVGGTSSPDRAVGETFHFHGDQVLRNAVVGATIASDGPFGVGLGHGWRKVGEPMIVTRSVKGQVFTLDDRPALQTYLKRLGAPAEAYHDPVAFDAFAASRPLGVRRRSGDEVRNVSSTEHLKEGWLRSSGEIPEGGLVWCMEGDEDSVLEAAGHACQAAIEALDGQEPLGFLAFDCDSRGAFLGDEGMRTEVDRLTGQAGGAPVAGFYTWGEIARTRGINGFHNQTLVVLAVG